MKRLLAMEPGVEEEKKSEKSGSLDSEDLKVSGDEDLLNDLNGSLSSSEFAEEIKKKVLNHKSNPK
jgi:hypothetical protein